MTRDVSYMTRDLSNNKCVAVCSAVCCSVLQCVAVCHVHVYDKTHPIICMLQCVAVCCSVLQCVAVCHIHVYDQTHPVHSPKSHLAIQKKTVT